MTAKSSADRVAALETKVGSKTIAEQFREQAELIDRRCVESFREQAELIDRLFSYRFEESDKKWDVKLDIKFGALEERLDGKLAKLEDRLDGKFARLEDRLDGRLANLEEKVLRLETTLAPIDDTLKMILARLP